MSWTKHFLDHLDPEDEEQLRYEQLDRLYQQDIEDRMIAAANQAAELQPFNPQPQPVSEMGAIKHYLIHLLTQCTDSAFGQDAIQHAILTGAVRLTYQLDQDIHLIMPRYDELLLTYRKHQRQRQPEVRLAA